MPGSQGNVSDQMDVVDAIRVHSHIGLDINEFLLFHGVKFSLIERLCVKSLDTRFAGENTGKMFGDGSFASSIAVGHLPCPTCPTSPGYAACWSCACAFGSRIAHCTRIQA